MLPLPAFAADAVAIFEQPYLIFTPDAGQAITPAA